MEKKLIISTQYNHAAEVIKTAILQGQYEALKGENRIQLAVYSASENTFLKIQEKESGEQMH